jgi:selenocysteine-specific elongation factor
MAANIIAGDMTVSHYILATAGHVDHGKTALVRALTGIDTDRLPEERARGITIELGFAHLDLPAPPGTDLATYRVGIVDVPGHEDFVKNMVAGVGSIDLALLIVAADDGWMPQTEEHLQILSYLGVRRGIVALTKIDLAISEDSTRAQIRKKLSGTPLAEAPIISASIVSGRGMEELKSALAYELSQIAPQPDLGKPRLAVDRAFTLRGAGTIITGTLTGGTLKRGQSVVIQPDATSARIRTVQSYNQEVEQALPGSRVALNLPDVQTGDSSHGGATVSRGDVVTLSQFGRASDTIDVLLEMSARSAQTRSLKEGTRVRFHHGSGNFPASVYFLGTSVLQPGQRVAAQFRFDSPVFAFAADRFILRNWSEQQTLAGGVILDPDASRRGFRSDQRRQFLQARADRPDDAIAFAWSEMERVGVVKLPDFLLKTRFGAAEISQTAQKLVNDGKATIQGAAIVDIVFWRDTRNKALAAIDAAHQLHPEEPGLRLSDLRQLLSKKMGPTDLFDAIVADLCRVDCVKAGVAIRRLSHRPALPERLQAAGARLRMSLSSKGLEPPSRKELTPDPLSQQAMRFLLQAGEAIEIGEDVVLYADHFNGAIDAIRIYLRGKGGATVSELKQVLKTSRRVMVPLLEKMDRDGITLRQGDKRVLRHHK